MRKLPIFFLIDISESMVGESIEKVRKGMEHLVRSLKQNPFALETAWIEIIGFAGKAKVIEPYEEIAMFYPPEFPIGGGTSIGKGLECLMHEIDRNVHLSTADKKGDWKPLVYIFTDGKPTDNYSAQVSLWQEKYKSRCLTVIATLGDVVTSDFISSIADDAIKLEDDNSNCFDSYFKWLTDSITKASVRVSEGIDLTSNEGSLDDGISKIDLTKQKSASPSIDDTYTILLGACQSTEKKFLVKYRKGIEVYDTQMNNFDKVYRLEKAYAIDYPQYKELSEQSANFQVNTQYLRGIPSCPHCSSKHAFAVCACGGIFCVDMSSYKQTCPWCGTSAVYSSVDDDFNINRRQG